MAKIYLFLANGFEEIEGLTVVDVLRRGGVEVCTVSLTGKTQIVGSHKISVEADSVFNNDEDYMDGDMLVLPGGLQGTNALMAHEGLRELLLAYRDAEKYLAAICAAPSVFGMNGLLKGRQATCYPGFEDKLLGARKSELPVVQDGFIVTAEGMGASIPFALHLLALLQGQSEADRIAETIRFRRSDK